MDFFVDTEGDAEIEPGIINNSRNCAEKTTIHTSAKLSPSSIISQILAEYNSTSQSATKNTKPSVKDAALDEAYATLQKRIQNGNQSRKPIISETSSKLNSNVEEVLQKSIITSNFEQLHAIPPIDQAKKKLKQIRQREKEKTKGKKWFGLPATELTEEVKKDLEVLQMRSVLDPKHFYKKNDLKVLPKYFQIGKVMDSPLDYYNNRCTKKERKKTLVDELMADAEFNKFNKKRYREIIEEQKKTHYKAYRQAKKLKRKKK